MTPKVARRREARRRWSWAVIDAVVFAAAVFLATWFRYDFVLHRTLDRPTLWVALAAAAAQVVVGAVIGPYAVGHQRGSFEETFDIGRTVVLVTAGLGGWAFFAHGLVLPRSIPIVAGSLALAGMFAIRFVRRAWNTRRTSTRPGERRVIIFGAGDGGRQLLRTMARDPHSTFTPVALLDDNTKKARLRIEGVRVRGTREAISAVADRYGAQALIVALPSANAALMRDLSARAEAAGLEVLVLPPLRDIVGKRMTEGDLRSIDLQDLLGRRPVSLDTTVIAEQIAGRSVLVTGAGGSIGSELCRQIARFGPAKLYLLDRDESGLQATQLSLTGQGLLDSDDIILANIRDRETMQHVFEETRPEIVFHAAALKHLPLLEKFPLEAWKTNVLGTLNVLQAAAEVGVATFVNISTDKAANPTCVLGYSKRVAERLTADFATRHPGRWVSVRFGNVLGSRGSVVHAFTAQIEQGGPVTVTHPDVERFFMLIPEACQLVLEAAAIGTDGEVMVLDMGEQVKIVEVANTLIRLSGRNDVDVVFTGLRAGEKLGEDLFSDNEIRRETAHSMVSSVDVPSLEAITVRMAHVSSHSAAGTWMRNEAGDVRAEMSVAASE